MNENSDNTIQNSENKENNLKKELKKLLLVIIAIIALAAMWKFTPVGEMLVHLKEVIAVHQKTWYAPLVVMVVYILATLVVVPINALILPTIFGFGAIYGSIYSTLGVIASATVHYFLARRISGNFIEENLERVSKKVAFILKKPNPVTVAMIRLLPFAPYTLESFVLSTSGVSFVAYMSGTLLGLLPPILSYGIFSAQLEAFFNNPDPITIVIFILVVGGLMTAYVLTMQYLRKRAELAKKEQSP